MDLCIKAAALAAFEGVSSTMLRVTLSTPTGGTAYNVDGYDYQPASLPVGGGIARFACAVPGVYIAAAIARDANDTPASEQVTQAFVVAMSASGPVITLGTPDKLEQPAPDAPIEVTVTD
ncbi:hypothetical protein [Paraburkholderia sp. J11-2]|uniref:hypothetical protein n=1 Tax=Paraburkholderia sp. J11-2 TaxID=2805431 RepID=UPI002AB6FC0E|nr:hypothetical protein [Paraburkholderia sp. J11-2]